MNNVKPPSHTLLYWKPWKENANLFDSWLDWLKDVSLTKYNADLIGAYINEASHEQKQAIESLTTTVNHGFQSMSNKMEIISDELKDINNNLNKIENKLSLLDRKLDRIVEEQVLTNVLLNNISELMRVPDSEKQRQHCIELGMKFFINAKNDEELYTDALEEFLKAENLMKQDYFVLHRIGMIYLYAPNLLDINKALGYFLRAGKYASIEMDPNATRLASLLTKHTDTFNSKINSSINSINLLAAESYEKAAFSSYILGDFQNAINIQNKVIKINPSSKNLYNLSKYYLRNKQLEESKKYLSESIDNNVKIFNEVLIDIDFLSSIQILEFVENKIHSKKNENDELINIFKSTPDLNCFIEKLNELQNQPIEAQEDKLKLFKNIYSYFIEGKLNEKTRLFISNNLDEIDSNFLIDYDGNFYNTIKIGKQIWITENYKCSHFSNGEEIIECTKPERWGECKKNNKPAYYKTNNEKYYNFQAISDIQKFTPSGWRLPNPSDIDYFEIKFKGLDSNDKTNAIKLINSLPNAGKKSHRDFSTPNVPQIMGQNNYSIYWTANKIPNMSEVITVMKSSEYFNEGFTYNLIVGQPINSNEGLSVIFLKDSLE